MFSAIWNDPGLLRQMTQDWEVWQKTYSGHGQFLMKILQLICLEVNKFSALSVNSRVEQRDSGITFIDLMFL